MTSLKAICQPETLEQYTLGSNYFFSYVYAEQYKSRAIAKAIVSFNDGSIDTITNACTFTSLDTFTAYVSVSGNVTARNTGIARIRVSRYGFSDTVEIPIVPTTATMDSLRLSLHTKTIGSADSLGVIATGHLHNTFGMISAVVDSYATWTSENTSLATVVKGKIQAMGVAGVVKISAVYKGKSDTLILTIVPGPSYIKRINFQVTAIPHRAGWTPDNGAAYTSIQGHGWLTPADISVKREDRSGLNYLFKTFINTARPTSYKIDAPDGNYLLRIGMGDITWGNGIYSWAAIGSDTILRKIPLTSYPGMPTYCNITTTAITISGGTGVTIVLNGFADYIILSSADKGTNVLCALADDDFIDPSCGGSTAVNRPQDLLKNAPTMSISPNPFNPTSNIVLSLPARSVVKLGVYDMNGALVNLLVSGVLGSGTHNFIWNAEDKSGVRVAAGIYLFRFDIGKKRLYERGVYIR
jgi:hypothetical protein